MNRVHAKVEDVEESAEGWRGLTVALSHGADPDVGPPVRACPVLMEAV